MATAEDYPKEVERVYSGNLEVRLAKNIDETGIQFRQLNTK